MKFIPKNRRLLVRRVGLEASASKKQKRTDGIILPENVKFEKRGNELYRILSKADDVSLNVEVGDYIVIENSMLEQNTFRVEKTEDEEAKDCLFLTVLENYVKGVITSWEEM